MDSSNDASNDRSASDNTHASGGDVGTDAAAGLARKTTVELFLERRGLSKSAGGAPPSSPGKSSPQRPSTFRVNRPPSTTTNVVAESQRPPPLWSSFTKRRHGNRVEFLRRALRIPEEDYSESKDAYTRRKKAKTFIALHADADVISRDFMHEMRHLFFEREIVDRPVCDLHENRAMYIERLKHAYSDDEGEDEDKGIDATASSPTELVA